MQEVSQPNDAAIDVAEYHLSNYSKELDEVNKQIKDLEQSKVTAEIRQEQLKGAVYAIQMLLIELKKPATGPEKGV